MDKPAAAFVPDLALLVAVTDATMKSEWASAAAIRAEIDGGSPAGLWARTLHAHTDAGYLERRGFSGPYRLTDKAVEAICDAGA